jgi:cobalt-zinc-cadmium efflux system outer membrane protein
MWTSARIPRIFILTVMVFLLGQYSFAQDLKLTDLIDEALKNNPDIIASQAKIEETRYRIPQVKSLPDTMLMFGYQNEGFSKYTYGKEMGSQWMFSASQEFPYPGKLALKGSMAESDMESLEAMNKLIRLKTMARVKELYYDLFLAYKNIDLLKDKNDLFARIEDLALTRYASGRSMQEDVLMAQMEKYMLVEKEEMFRQKILSDEAMLNAVLGRKENAPVGKPIEAAYEPYLLNAEDAVNTALNNSYEIKSGSKMVEAAAYKILIAEKEYYPDFTINTGYSSRAGRFRDMWNATVGINIPIFNKTRRDAAVQEARASLAQAKQELEATKLMISAAVKDNLSIVRSSEKLMDLYKNGLIPKNTQSVESALAGYTTGKTEMITVISLSKALLDYETFYWDQFVQREKAIARLEAITAWPSITPGGVEE